jgi:hypothetical protein
MRIKVYVIELSPAGKRSLVLGGAVAIVLAMTLRADANVPNMFTTGETLSAAQMNANFADIDSWRAHPVVTKNGKQFSVGAIYCGLTPSTTGQIAGGYAGAKSLCETACSSTSAHLCTGPEIVATAEAGVTVPFGPTGLGGGWYAAVSNDCISWTTNSHQVSASCWNNGASCTVPTGDPFSESCDATYPILCCD